MFLIMHDLSLSVQHCPIRDTERKVIIHSLTKNPQLVVICSRYTGPLVPDCWVKTTAVCVDSSLSPNKQLNCCLLSKL